MDLPEIRTRATAMIEIPVQLSRLRDIAYNLWWSWSPSARALFDRIDTVRWTHYRNPIELLIDLEPQRWHELQQDIEFIKAYRALAEEFDCYMAPEQPTWFAAHHGDRSGGPIAYFSTEYGWHESLQIYSGGLGVLSGDHSKAASDLGLPFVGIGLMYRHGYFWQTVDSEGQQQHFYPDYDMHRLPLLPVLDNDGNELRVEVPFPDRRIWLRVWKAAVGRVPVLLLDCDIRDNHPADRSITSVLYVNAREMRFCQEIVLGLGGCQVLKDLGIRPSVWHMNEGHSALLSLARIGEIARSEKLDVEAARKRVSGNAVLTTHTPVPAGNETFDRGLVRGYLAGWCDEHALDVEQVLDLGRGPDGSDSFNMTALALRTTARANGVSEVHGRVATDMWKPLLDAEPGRTIEHITNGVHLPTWIGREMREVLQQHLGGNLLGRLLEPGFAEVIEAIPDAELWQAHLAQKRCLIALARLRSGEQLARHGLSPSELRRIDELLDPDVLLIGFARRFATYKRADLFLRDFDRLQRIVNDSERPIQFLFAGKAHPADKPGQDLIRRIWQTSMSSEIAGRLLFLENYDMRIGAGMVQGVDVWLNTPRRPLEASGTSGMKAAINGGLQCSVLDGWWCEGYDPCHGWAISQEFEGDPVDDERDADSLYRLLTDDVAPCYYRRGADGLPREWIGRMKKAIGQLSPRFSSTRQVREYAERYYLPPDDAGVTTPASASTDRGDR